MKVRDAVRAQFYLPFLEPASARVREALKDVEASDVAREFIVNEFETELAGSLDDILLPTAVSIIQAARARGALLGITPGERYRSAFLNGKEWTEDAKAIPRTSQVVFDQLSTLAAGMSSEVVRCLRSLARAKVNPQVHPRNLEKIEFTSGDRHAVTGQPLFLTFQDGGRRIYKHGDHSYYALIAQLSERFRLPGSLRLRFPKVAFFEDFALIEFVAASSPATSREARQLYQNFGALIAFMDLINYCDGHFDNVVIAGSCPVVVDLETIFHSYNPALRPGEERSILYTGLIQVPPKDVVDEGISSSMQMPTGLVHELAKPIVLNDRTDDISLRYRGLSHRFSASSAVAIGYKVEDYVADVEFGFATCFDEFMANRTALLDDADLWRRIARTRLRQVMRTTLYYLYLMRRNQMPDIAGSQDSSLAWFADGLKSEPKLRTYETYELRHARVPIFFHFPDSRDLIDAYNGVYCTQLPTKSAEEVRNRWAGLDSSYRERSLELIRRNLSTTLFVPTLGVS